MSLPSIVSYGAGAKTSTLVWDSDLTIPDGYAIDSASGEVGIVGDVSVSGAMSIAESVSANSGINGCVYYADWRGNTSTTLNLSGGQSVSFRHPVLLSSATASQNVLFVPYTLKSVNGSGLSPNYPIYGIQNYLGTSCTLTITAAGEIYSDGLIEANVEPPHFQPLP